MSVEFDVAVIGAGPSGSVASALLNKQGFKVCVLEKQHFPRFVIGESLLPHCMEMLEEAGFADAVHAEPSFQFKDGAAFSWGSRYTDFNFTEKFSDGPGTIYQVRRGIFDKILIDEAAKQGVDVRFGHGVTAFDNSGDVARLSVATDTGENYELTAKFVLDASGYGRVLPRLLDLESPSELPPRQAHFTHIDDNITSPKFDRNKILINTHPEHRDVWIWLIPFSDNRCSIGVVGTPDKLAGESEAVLKKFVYECPMLAEILDKAVWEKRLPVPLHSRLLCQRENLVRQTFRPFGQRRRIPRPRLLLRRNHCPALCQTGCRLVGQTTQRRSRRLANRICRPLMIGVNAFRTYVNGWYDFRFQNAIYAPNRSPEISRMISSILAGYAWDTNNPFVEKSEQRLSTLAALVGDLKVE